MKKQAYMKPAMRVVKIQHQCQILAGSVNGTGGNTGLGYGGGSSGVARSRSFGDWDDEE